MKHLDLFTGIGGFALAAQTVWGDEYEPIAFCDNDYFCQQTLQKNFPGVPIYGDIRTITNTESIRTQRRIYEQRWNAESEQVDLLTGGFPCQPFSAAGKRRGTADDRHLWPEMFRVISEFKPTWVIAENVRGLLTWNEGMVFEQVCSDLEGEGYEVQPFVIPACSVNAPHRRDRIWFVANSKSLNGKWLQQKGNRTERSKGEDRNESWSQNWLEVATRLCGMDDGLPKRLARLPDGNTITEAKWRKEALKGYGNAIVPQVAMQIMKAIKEADEN